MKKVKISLVDVFKKAIEDEQENQKALPQRLIGRGNWLKERGRIKDCELMYSAANEIEQLRKRTKRSIG